MDKVYWIRLYSHSIPLGPFNTITCPVHRGWAGLEVKMTALGGWVYPHSNPTGPLKHLNCSESYEGKTLGFFVFCF